VNVYLHDIPLEEAHIRFQAALINANLWQMLGSEIIPLDEQALGRVLAAPVWAKISSPHYHAAAMDGFAVLSSRTAGASPSTPVILSYGTQTVYVDTGDPMPDWADAVIPIEDVESLDENECVTHSRYPFSVRIRNGIPPWRYVRPVGEDIIATELVLPQGHILRAVDLGAIAACGHTSLLVSCKPRVAILPTGTELVPIGCSPKAGDIIEYNSLVLAAQIKTWGGVATRYPIIPDEFEAIQNKVIEAAKHHDLILLNAGSSAGSEDFSAHVIQSLGEVHVHGVAVRPGHPVILGILFIDNKYTPIIGVPGYPVSAALTGEIFVEPILAKWLGRNAHTPECIEATLTQKVNSPAGDDDFMRVAIGSMGDKVLAAPLSRGSGVITSLVRADGITIIPRGSQGLSAGDKVIVRLYRSRNELLRTIFSLGSHDVALDLMAQFLSSQDRRLVSANVGSLGGLIAIRRHEAHIAGSHLLDPETGEYNLRYIHEYIPEIAVRVITLVERQQGLMVMKGNPKGIFSIEDIARHNIMYVNRQRGAGTRVLFDYHISRLGINPAKITGYEREEYTHLAVASAIVSGRADCGMGIAAASHALDLDFLPMFNERYDLVIPVEHAESDLLKPLLQLLNNDAYKNAVASLPGYDVKCMGKVII